MIDYQRLFHTGIRVPDLDAAMEEMGETLGVTWAKPRSTEGQAVWTPEDGQQKVPLRYVYSSEGPQHIELLEGPAGSIWDGREDPGVHHVGVWADDVQAETERCVANGWRVAAANVSPEEGYGSYTYVVPPSGPIIELVNGARRLAFETWWAGGD
jgi:lactoylglutathione lyase